MIGGDQIHFETCDNSLCGPVTDAREDPDSELKKNKKEHRQSLLTWSRCAPLQELQNKYN